MLSDSSSLIKMLTLTTNLCLPGTQHVCKVMLCRCEDPAVTLLRYNLWPATPTSQKVAFDVRFMEMLSVLQLECHLPAKTFCEALGYLRSSYVNLASNFVSKEYCMCTYFNVTKFKENMRNGGKRT